MFLLILLIILPVTAVFAQKDYNGPPLFIDVNRIELILRKSAGENAFTNQWSWKLTGSGAPVYNSEIWNWPADEWRSKMLYQIMSPVILDDNGRIDQFGTREKLPQQHVDRLETNDWSLEQRRYRRPDIVVNGVSMYPAYTWKTDRSLKPDIVASFEDLKPWYGIRTRAEIYAFSNPNHQDYVIYKAVHKFTGETRLERDNPEPEDYLPDQTITMWKPIEFSFGPSKRGDYEVWRDWIYEGADDLDSWMGIESELVRDRERDSLKIAYYWDSDASGPRGYDNGSDDDTGDPDRGTGHLLSPQIPGYALLYACKSPQDPSDDPQQPYSIPHNSIVNDFWGDDGTSQRNKWLGHDTRGKFPLDPVTEGFYSGPVKGPMRFINCGPYEMTKSDSQGVYDSITLVYAIGTGSISWELADSIGKGWFKGEISDEEKRDIILTGKDSLAHVIDKAYWAWSRGLDIPDPPPPPDVTVNDGPDRCEISWSYPDPSYFNDPDTEADDWFAWRIYRKRGAAYVNDFFNDNYSGERWELIYETTERNETSYYDEDVTRGVSYYYAVTAMDDGSQNTDGLYPGQKLESSRYVTRSLAPAIPYQSGLAESDKVRVVPNPYTYKGGALNFPGERSKILFVNLPYKCTLRIFTETGDRITTLEHIGTDQKDWDQVTETNEYIVSGIYILAVTGAEDVNGKSLPDHFVKFTVIR